MFFCTGRVRDQLQLCACFVIKADQLTVVTSPVHTWLLLRCEWHGGLFCLFADDKQGYVSGRVSQVDNICHQLVDYVQKVTAWCVSCWLQLNVRKTQLIWFGSRVNRSKLSGHDISISTGSEIIKLVNSVRDLGFQLDSKHSMKQHINTIARIRFYHLWQLRRIHHRAGYKVTVKLVLALIKSRVDFCNALLASLPMSTITPQNAAVWLVLQLWLLDHISQGLHELHWLLICASVLYKLCSDVRSTWWQFTGLHQRHCHYMLFSFAVSINHRLC